MLEKVINSEKYYQIINRYTYYCNTKVNINNNNNNCNGNGNIDTRLKNSKSSTDTGTLKRGSILPEPTLITQKSTFRMEEEERQLIEAKSRLHKVPSECCCYKIIRIFNDEPSPYHFDYYLSKPTSHNIDNLLFQLKQAYGYAKRTSTSFRTRKSDTTTESSARSSLNLKIHANSLNLLVESHNIKMKSSRRTMSVKTVINTQK